MDMKADKSWIHTINKKMVLTLIRERGPIYKAEIARLTGLSIPTVIKITDELAEHGLVRDIGKGMSSGGKPPQLLEFASERYAIIGVDVGTTNINCVLMDLAANVLCQYTTPTIVSDPSKQVIERIAAEEFVVRTKSAIVLSRLVDEPLPARQ